MTGKNYSGPERRASYETAIESRLDALMQAIEPSQPAEGSEA